MMMQRILLVATREFSTTVRTKGFLISVLLMPLLVLLISVLAPRFVAGGPGVNGQIEVIDPTGVVTGELRKALDPAAITARRARSAMAEAGGDGRRGADSSAGSIPKISIIEKTRADDIAKDKQWLTQSEATPDARHSAVVVLHPDAVVRPPGRADYGTYNLYLAPHADDAVQTVLREAMREALIAARFKNVGVDQQAIESSMRIAHPVTVVVTPNGERAPRSAFAGLLPVICGILLFIGVISGGQILLTSTIEEKSSRIVEVLLAAVSPMELMSGKLIGQLGVSLLIMAVYVGLGMLALSHYSLSGLIDPALLVCFIVFFLLAYLVYGGLMLAIGASVNQAAEAQSMMGPVMLLMIAPYVLVPFIGRAPNSSLSVAMSFVPPVNSFVILARLASGTPPPIWQVLGAVLAGMMGAVLAVWFAAKIFKIGLLLHGKPPSFGTLIRWARMA
jgi:ABC-type Na+ efflux pump permease subunit